MGTLFKPILDLWQRLTLGQRAGLVITIGIVIAIAAGAVNYTTRPVYSTLYAGVNSKDASRIVDKLRDQKIPYELSADGGTIKVPEKSVSQLRLDFAGQGLPSSGDIGYELFDKPMLGMTDFMQKMNYHRALEGEIARTIADLDAVESARVHLVVPQPRLFEEDKKPATASIVVQLHANARLTPEQVQGIAYLTAYSVEGLDLENITIVDQRGNLLTNAASRDGMAGLSATQLDLQRKIEKDLETKAIAMLQDVLGPNKAQVKVSAKLNWNRVERTVENYDPDRTATLSEERQESTGGQSTDNSGGGTSERSVTNYQVPKTVEKFVPEVGNIERITASVLVDGNYKTTKGADGKDTRTFVDRSPQELDKFKSLVASAIGYDIQRKDEITVLSFPFTAPEESVPVKDMKGFWLRIMEKVVLGLVIIGLFLIVRSMIKRIGMRLPALPAGQMQMALAEGESPMMLAQSASYNPTPAQVAAGASAMADSARAAAGLPQGSDTDGKNRVIFKESGKTVVLEDSGPTVEALKHQELLRRTTEYVLKKPENATQILRSWIFDESVEKHSR